MCLCQIWILLTIKKFLLNLIGVFPLYGIRAPFLLNSLRREMSSLPEGFLFTANYMTNFSHQKISGPTFIFKADSVYVVKHPSDWSWGCWFWTDDYGGNRDPLGSFCWIAALKRLGSKSDQLICKSVFICTCMGFLFPPSKRDSTSLVKTKFHSLKYLTTYLLVVTQLPIYIYIYNVRECVYYQAYASNF